MTEKEFDKKWGNVNTDELTDLQFIAFKQDCFELYEENGFLNTFQSPYEEHKDKIGMKFEVVRRATIDNIDIENLPIWLVKFENGDFVYCYPEEITKLGYKEVKGE